MKNRKLYLIATYILGCYVSFSQGSGLPADNTPPPTAPLDNVFYLVAISFIAIIFSFTKFKKHSKEN